MRSKAVFVPLEAVSITHGYIDGFLDALSTQKMHYDHRHSIPRCLTNRSEDGGAVTGPNLHADAHSSGVGNICKAETATCPSSGEWMHRVWYRHTMAYYITVGKKEVWYRRTTAYYSTIGKKEVAYVHLP